MSMKLNVAADGLRKSLEVLGLKPGSMKARYVELGFIAAIASECGAAGLPVPPYVWLSGSCNRSILELADSAAKAAA